MIFLITLQTPVRATGKFERYFIQPAFGLNKKIMHVSFVPRLALVDFNEFSSDAAVSPYIAADDPKGILRASSNWTGKSDE